MFANALIVFFVISVLPVSTLAQADRVPVLMWTSDESVSFPEVLAGRTISGDAFEDDYIEQLLKKDDENIVVFVQDKLSVADISHYANVYGYNDDEDVFVNLKSIMSKRHSTHLPNVLSPLSALTNAYKQRGMDARILKEPFNIDEPHLDKKSKNARILIVELPPTDHSDHKKSFSHIDKIIGSVMTQIAAMSRPFTALYTAVSSSQVLKTSKSVFTAETAPQVRQLLQYTQTQLNENGTFLNASDMIYMYATNINLSIENNVTQLNLQHLVVHSANCTNSTVGNSSCTLLLEYMVQGPIGVGPSAIEDVKLEFLFTASGYVDIGYWMLSGLNLGYANDTGSGKVHVIQQMDPSPIQDWSPIGFSYSCFTPDTVVAKNSSGSIYLSFKSFQIQAFGPAIDPRGPYYTGFGMYNDCEGFFSLPIWMALLSMAVMLAILIFGICMLSSITTMDRFDDAKGKTITVTATD